MAKHATENRKRKVCFVITSKIHYSRNRKILEELKRHPKIDLQIVVGGSALLEKYGVVLPEIVADGFTVDAQFHMTLDGSSPMTMAKSAGIGLVEISTVFDSLKPDVVLVRGDRYEVLSVTMAAAYMNITVAHIEGGDVTGSIDESVRHAITKLAHIHFPSNADSAARIIRMGERKDCVFTVGSPELELVKENAFRVSDEFINSIGAGDVIKLDEPFIMVMQHPVTSEAEQGRAQITETLHAVNNLGVKAIWFWPNVDAGSDLISKGIRMFREFESPEHIRFVRYLPAQQFYGLLAKAACLVGNSSAGFKEAALLGTPVVNIGTRQAHRYSTRPARHLVTVPYDRTRIEAAISRQLKRGRLPPDSYLYRKNTARAIVDILAKTPLYTQKRFVDK